MKTKKKKFYPKFEPQYVEVIVHDKKEGILRKLMIIGINYTANCIQVVGEL